MFYLNDYNLNKLLKVLNKLNLKSDLEFIVECNLGILNVSNLEIMKKSNVNRFSIGL